MAQYQRLTPYQPLRLHLESLPEAPSFCHEPIPLAARVDEEVHWNR